jgi:hypothetical protein
MNRKLAIALVIAAAFLGAIAMPVLRNGRQAVRQTAGVASTTREGRWEVPVIEGGQQTRTFTLAKNKHMHVRVNDASWEFGEGEKVTVLWRPGYVFINDVQVQPYPDQRIILSASDVAKRYGRIPTVQAYLAKHRGAADDDEVSTRAVESWYAKVEEVERRAAERYRKLLANATPRVAVEGARELMLASGLADSVAVRRDLPEESEAQALDVIWKGQRGQPGAIVGVSFSSETSEIPPPTVTAKRLYKDLVDMLDLLTYGENELAVRYEGGTLILDGQVVSRPESETR